MTLSIAQFVVAMAITLPVTELELPVHRDADPAGPARAWLRGDAAARGPAPRRVIAGAGAAVVAVSVFAGVSIAMAQLKRNEIGQSMRQSAPAR